MKKVLTIAVIALMVLGISVPARAAVYTLAEGSSFVNPVGSALPGGTLVASIIDATFTGKNVSDVTKFTGTYSHWVLSNATGLVFMYQFVNGTTEPVASLSRLATTDFTDFLTSGSFDMNPQLSGYGSAATADTTPSVLDRDNGTVGMGFANDASVPTIRVHPGDTSPLLWIQTNAKYYVNASSSIIDGGTANVLTYGPATPEPGSAMLLGMGLLGVAGAIRRKFKA